MITKENATEWLPLVAALAEGKDIQWLMDNGLWYPTDRIYDVKTDVKTMRVAPEPRKVPLSAEDIPAVCWVRQLPYPQCILVTEVFPSTLVFANRFTPYDMLMQQGYEYSTDRKNWKPCWKEVSE